MPYVTVIVFQSHERVSTPGWERRQSGSAPTANQNMCNVGFSKKNYLRTKFNMIESKHVENDCERLVLEGEKHHLVQSAIKWAHSQKMENLLRL